MTNKGEYSNQYKVLMDQKTADRALFKDHTDTDNIKKLAEKYKIVEDRAKLVNAKLMESGVNNTTAPDADEFELEWVHGYRGFDTRNNVFYVEANANGNPSASEKKMYAVYHGAALGICVDLASRAQKYFRGHDDDIMSMAVYTNEGSLPIIATGQQGKCSTFVWEVPTMKLLSSIKTGQKSINFCTFSKCGRLLITMSEDKLIAITDWKSNTIMVNTQGENSVTNHLSPSFATSSSSFISCGDKYIKYWTLNGRNLVSNKISTAKAPKEFTVQNFWCVFEMKDKVFMGTNDGYVYVSNDFKDFSYKFDHHKSKADRSKLDKNIAGVVSIAGDSNKNIMITGAKDGSITIYNTNSLSDKSGPEVVRHFLLFDSNNDNDINKVAIPDITAKGIHSISIAPNTIEKGGVNGILLLVSTRGCDMFELFVPSSLSLPVTLYERKGNKGFVTRGHCNDELWGLATHPFLPYFITVGDDKSLKFFSCNSRNQLACVPLGQSARACAYHPSGRIVAVGFGTGGKGSSGGMVRIYTAEPLLAPVTKIDEKTDAKQWISDIKFSSDGNTLVAGAHDNKIYVYDLKGLSFNDDTNKKITASIKLRTTFSKHNSVINHLDISSDGRFAQSNCSAYELLFSDITTGIIIIIIIIITKR